MHIEKIASEIIDKEIQVQGFGKLTVEQIEKSIKEKLNDVNRKLKDKDYKNVFYILYKAGVLKAMLEALLEQQEE